ncbi:MAG: hypothetical protein KJ585_12190 [Alphaproteobacteria bacterium]|jgi:hypothetical protein|uniref:hypothetical protein n=1 Tax=Sphingobium sp. YR657 TaxID=1884366 RepID=UPI0031380411|nr:hypothetical protein [Alphaproteobacteria bacterium]
MTDPVGDAVSHIHDKLDTSGWFNTVTNGETKDIVGTLTALPADQADQTIDRLQQSGDLDRVADEVMDGDWFGNGGLSGDERRAFLSDMAGKLDGDSLAALSDAFARADNGGFDSVTELGDAVATHAAPQTKVDYIAAMKNGVDDASQSSYGLGYSGTQLQDAEATAVGDVLASLRGSYAEAGFNAIGDKLSDVLTSALDGQMTTIASQAGATNSITWNADSYEAIMGAAASMGNADLKAQIFDAGVHTMREVRDTNNVFGGLTVLGKDDAMRQMANGLTAIIDSDTTGVMDELTFNQSTMDGSSFAAYAKEMLNQNREGELGQQMGRLQVGNDSSENPVERLNAVETVPGTTQERRANAGALGYFVGGVYAATQARSQDVAEQRETVTAILKSALTVVDKVASLGGPTGRVIAGGAAVGKEWMQIAVKNAIADEGSAAGIRLERAALPVNAQTGELGVGDNVASAFEDRLASVTRTAQP